jgi:hypothetical protein
MSDGLVCGRPEPEWNKLENTCPAFLLERARLM